MWIHRRESAYIPASVNNDNINHINNNINHISNNVNHIKTHVIFISCFVLLCYWLFTMQNFLF